MTDRVARVFCSYSHRDDEFRQELEVHLSPLIRQNLITFWYDRRIGPGDEWRKEIATQLDEADIILLLISAYFISSDYCYRVELGRALQRHDEDSAVVIPIFVRTCDWEGLDFARLQGLPPDGVPVNDYDDRDKAWVLVTKGVRQARVDLFARKPRTTGIPSLSEASRAEVNRYEIHAYLRHLVTSYERDPWTANAISLSAEIGGQIVPVESAFENWATGVGGRLLLLTGDPGAGKTCAFRRFAAILADRILRGNSCAPQPLYVPFRSLQGHNAILAISTAVPEAGGVLERLTQRINTVVFLDGIDEVPAQFAQEGVQLLIDLLERTSETTRLAVSCRTQVAPSVVASLRSLGYVPSVCAIREASIQQVYEYLEQFGLGAALDPATIRAMRHPILLRMFKEALLQRSMGGAPGMAEIYTIAITAWLRAAQELDRRLADVPQEVMLSVMTGLTEQMFPRLTVSIDDVRVSDRWKARKLDIINGLVATGLVTLDAREFIAFSHVSLFEFFFARLLHEELAAWNAEHLAMSNLIYSYNVNRFLIPSLLRDAQRQLTRQGHAARQRLERDAACGGGVIVTRPILGSDFFAFVEDTGWRRATGFGQWLTFTAADGTPPSSDTTIMPDAAHISLARRKADESLAVALSWYDAFQFARWVGGRLPLEAELRRPSAAAAPEMEWTSDWLDESQALLRVIRKVGGHPLGVNPDVRSSRIGFRVSLLQPSFDDMDMKR